MSELQVRASTNETPPAASLEAPSAPLLDSLDDFLSDLGLTVKPLSNEEKFILKLSNGINLDNITFKIRARCQDFRDMRRNGFIIQHKTLRKGVLGLFDVSIEELIASIIKDHLLLVYTSLFDKRLAGEELYLEINETVLLLLATDQMKNTILICKDYDKGGKYE
jgi:hypothetical protein